MSGQSKRARAMAYAIRSVLFIVLLAASFPVPAQRVEGDRARAVGLHSAEVTVNGQGPGERNGAFARGLLQVLQRITGDRGVSGKPGVGDELRRAKDYVDKYDYRQDQGVGASGAPSFRTTLVVQYDAEKVDEIISTLGLQQWPTPRPKPVLWLAINDGRGPRLVGLAQNDAARAVLDRARARGYALGLPAGNAAEQALVGAIWRGDTAAIARASAKYSPPMQLVGKLYRDGAGWKADWIFVDGGRVLSRWSETADDARRLLPTGADGAADALTRRYAKASPAGAPSTQPIVFTGINSSADFIRLSAQLQRMSVVRGMRPVRATPQGLEIELDLLTGLTGFRRMADAQVLVEADGNIEGVTPVFHLR